FCDMKKRSAEKFVTSAVIAYLIVEALNSLPSDIPRLTTAATLPRLLAGSIGTPAASLRRSMLRRSAAAAIGPSNLARTLAGGFFTLVSATSNVPFDIVSLRPDGI